MFMIKPIDLNKVLNSVVFRATCR